VPELADSAQNVRDGCMELKAVYFNRMHDGLGPPVQAIKWTSRAVNPTAEERLSMLGDRGVSTTYPDVFQDLLCERWVLVQGGVMALAVNVVAEKPPNGSAGHDVSGEMAVGREARANNAPGIPVTQQLDPQLMGILVRYHGRQRERLNCMAGRKAGVHPGGGCFEAAGVGGGWIVWTLPGCNRHERLHDDSCVRQRFERQ